MRGKLVLDTDWFVFSYIIDLLMSKIRIVFCWSGKRFVDFEIDMIEAKNKGREPSGFLYDQLDTLLVELEK